MRDTKRRWIRWMVVITTSLLPVASSWSETDSNWPSFRGPRASGIADGFAMLAEWDLDTADKTIWRTPIPGLAHSSPVIWGDLICLTSAVRLDGDQSLKVGLYGEINPVEDEGAHRWIVLCLDKRSGQIEWQRVLREGAPRTKRHTKSTHANSTPAIDGEHLVVFFGSEGLFGLDLEGNVRWQRDLGVLDSGFYVAPTAQWGFGSSPIIHAGRVVIQVDVLTDDYVAAFDVRSGDELWRTARKEVPTWSSPTIYEVADETRIAVNGWQHAGGYDLDTGEEVWRFTGGGDIPVPTPIIANDLIFLTSSHGFNSPVFAIRTDATGDITLTGDSTSSESVVWGKLRDGAYMPTPLVYKGLLFVLRDNGTLFCYDAESGQEHYKVRLGEGSTGFSASPVAGDGKLYFTSEMGDVFVVRAGSEFELLARSTTGEVTMATPAISEGVLYFRTRKSLLAVGEKLRGKVGQHSTR